MSAPKVVQKVVRHGLTMREGFDYVKANKFWYPGHMAQGTMGIQRVLSEVDFVIEVHDARIPFTGRNMTLQRKFVCSKPSITIMNKFDLVPYEHRDLVMNYCRAKISEDVIFSDAVQGKQVFFRKLLPMITSKIDSEPRYNREGRDYFVCLVLGVPNVGKSSIINAMRIANIRKSRKAASVGVLPGHTRSVQTPIKISEDPLIYIRDTPGILEVRPSTSRDVLKLVLARSLNWDVMDMHVAANYLLFRMNYEGNHSYMDFAGIEEPTDDYRQLCIEGCRKNGYYQMKIDFNDRIKKRMLNLDIFAHTFLMKFHEGTFGPMMIDEPKLLRV